MSKRSITSAQAVNYAIKEKDFRQQVITLAKICGWKHYFTWTSIHSPRGMPDLILCRPPRLVFAELKTMKGQLSEYQAEWMDLLSDTPHCEVYLWKPDSWEVIQAVLASADPYQGPERWTRENHYDSREAKA